MGRNYKLTTALQSKIVEMRAQGFSWRQISETLHIGRNTLNRWEPLLSFDIMRREKEYKEQVIEEARVSNKARLEVIKGLSAKLMERIATADFSTLPLDKAINLLTKLQEKGSEIAYNMTHDEDFYNANRGDKRESILDFLGED